MTDVTTLRGHWQSRLQAFDEVLQGDAAIGQSIQTILGTQKRSVPLKPDFGIDWFAVQDKPMSEAPALLIAEAHSALERWEKRIKVIEVEPFLDGEKLRALVHWKRKEGGERRTTSS